MSILVVGSVAYDTVETPFGRADRVLGGSATFFAVAASFFVAVNLVGVVGEDFGEAQLAAFRGRDIDLEGLERVPGKTFHGGFYSFDLTRADHPHGLTLRYLQAEIPASTGAPSTASWQLDPASARRPRQVAAEPWPATPDVWIERNRTRCAGAHALDVLLSTSRGPAALRD